MSEQSWISSIVVEGVQPAPAPWSQGRFLHAGGVFAIGFALDNDLILVVTHDGGGVFDPRTGEKVARDADWKPDGPLMHGLVTKGLGPLAHKEVHLAGIAGGGLLRATEDGWFVDVVDAHVQGANAAHVFLRHLQVNPPSERYTCIYSDSLFFRDIWGFSPSGRVLAYGQGDGVVVWTR